MTLKSYAEDAVYCPTTGNRETHDLTYMGRFRRDGRVVRTLEYRCNRCGLYITKEALKTATEGEV